LPLWAGHFRRTDSAPLTGVLKRWQMPLVLVTWNTRALASGIPKSNRSWARRTAANASFRTNSANVAAWSLVDEVGQTTQVRHWAFNVGTPIWFDETRPLCSARIELRKVVDFGDNHRTSFKHSGQRLAAPKELGSLAVPSANEIPICRRLSFRSNRVP
jgi:hypothetical protein